MFNFICLLHFFLHFFTFFFTFFYFLVPGWKPEGPIESGLSVRSFGTAYLKNRSEDFSEIWYEVGGQFLQNHSTAAFLNFCLVFSKTAHLCFFEPKVTSFRGFWDFAEKPRRGFFLNFAKMCQKMVLTFWQNFRKIYRAVSELFTEL